jgi:hypothetical protein
MSSEPNRDELRLAMDACRADSRDLSLPAMDALAERLAHDPACAAEFAKAQRQDRLLRTALKEVPIPSGLVERTLSVLPSQRPETSLVEPVALTDASAKTPKSTRRRYLMFGFSAAAAVLLAVVFGTYWMAPKVGSVALLEEEAASLLATPAGVAWSSDLARPAVSFPYEPWLRVVPKRWRAVTLGGDQGVLYDLVGGDDAGAILIVISTSKRYELPISPQTTNAGGSSGLRRQIAWKQPGSNSGLVYVLAIGDRQSDPKQLLRPQKLVMSSPDPQSLASR